MRKHLIFLIFIVMIFILALVVKINNDQKKKQELNRLELVEKKANYLKIELYFFNNDNN